MSKKQILFNEFHSISKLKQKIKEYSPTSVFLVTGKESYFDSGSETFIKKLLYGINYTRFSEFEKNPKEFDVKRGKILFNKHKCDFIIAIGGGSVIDMAKLINSSQAFNGSVRAMIEKNGNFNKPIKKLVAIPTTSGAGSEATHFAVLYIDNIKHSFSHLDFLLADYVFLYPKLTHSMNTYQTAISGLDAYCQSIESYWSVNSTNESKNYASESINILTSNLFDAVIKNSLTAKNKISYAAYLAGKAINISKTTGAHAMSYFLTSEFNIPHGHAVALTIAQWFEFNVNTNFNKILDKRGLDYLNKTMTELSKLIKSKDLKSSKNTLETFIKSLGIETSLSKFGVENKDFKNIVKSVNLERLKNNPIKIEESQILNIVKNIY